MQPVTYVQEARAYIEPEPKVVLIEVGIDWTEERIQKEIHSTFPEEPWKAEAIFKCENGWSQNRGWDVGIVGPTSDYGIAQIHKPTWHNEAMDLGYTNYQTEVIDNLKMARHVYEVQGWTAWVCYTKGWWTDYL